MKSVNSNGLQLPPGMKHLARGLKKPTQKARNLLKPESKHSYGETTSPPEPIREVSTNQTDYRENQLPNEPVREYLPTSDMRKAIRRIDEQRTEIRNRQPYSPQSRAI